MTIKPIVMNINANLYAKHVKHLSKAEKFSYNYTQIDDYIVENYKTKTLKQMAHDLNEYYNRIVYRYQWLQDNKIIVTPAKEQRLELAAKKAEHNFLSMYFKMVFNHANEDKKEAERKFIEAYRDHVVAMAKLEELNSNLAQL